MVLKVKTKGYLDLKDGRVDITDPCYNKDVWCRMNAVKVRPGIYRCRYYMGFSFEEDDKKLCKESEMSPEMIKKMESDCSRRCFVAEIQLKGRSFQLNSRNWKSIGKICVDAGMAGFFIDKPDFNDEQWDDFYSYIIGQKSSCAYLKPELGFWTESGYGDGTYEVYAIKENGEIIALKIEF